jgi:hypothetical protein
MICLVESAAVPVNARGELRECEEIIKRGLNAFFDVGNALSHIRDSELYKGTHPTFEAYCLERWKFTRRRADQLVAAAQVENNCSQHDLPSINHESHARVLGRLPPEEQSAAWREVVTVAKGVITAKLVATVVRARLPQRAPQPKTAITPHRSASIAIADLEALAAQRNSDPDYAAFRNMQRAVAQALPSRAHRIDEFVRDGGELALLRLGLDWTVTAEALKKTYRDASRTAHPDKGGDEDEFKALTRAYKLVRTMLGVEN